MDALRMENNRDRGRSAASPLSRRPDVSLDIRRDNCPVTFVKTRLALEAMESGQILELLIKGEEPLRNVPRTVKSEGHKIISARRESDYYRLLIRKA